MTGLFIFFIFKEKCFIIEKGWHLPPELSNLWYRANFQEEALLCKCIFGKILREIGQWRGDTYP